ncbi:helix-turn-helix transcriptional regulator [Aliamphritea hakodatensis]|uniref:helix-turn-helix transcriptional regulator n=1 Tax=Aliamphritea hakodatensis TaxID=2895352 RepID=UPI0022FD5782|nr:LuxR C-terminal-related transcriptional regulator [Aliamphritea hakodatensis]
MTTSRRPKVPASLLQKWQHVIDLLARLSNTPAVLITQVRQDDISLLLRSSNAENPFRPRGFNKRCSDMYCDRVVKGQSALLVEDAHRTRDWKNAPDVENGMSFYLGYPLNWPDAEPFGTICVMDYQADNRALDYRHLMEEFQSLINHDLKLLQELQTHRQQQSRLEQHLESLNTEINNRATDLDEINTALRVLLRQRESDRQVLEQETCAELSQHISPLLEQLASDPLSEAQQECLQLIRQQLLPADNTPLQNLRLLSPAEHNVVSYIQAGKSSKEIAALLHISKKTVDYHRQNIRKKLGLNSASVSLKSYLTPYFPRT